MGQVVTRSPEVTVDLGGGAFRRDIPRNLPKNSRMIALGDSRTAFGVGNGAFVSKGTIPWLRVLTRQAFDCDLADIFATSGYTTAQIVATHLPGAVASTAGACLVLAGINDRNVSAGPMTYAQTIANLTVIRDQLKASGKTVIFLAETPRGNSTFTADRLTGGPLADHLRVRQWLLSQSQVSGCYVIDPWEYLADQASTTGDNQAIYYGADAVHPTQYGAFYGYGKVGAPVLNKLFPPRPILPASNTDVYDAVNNLTGVLSTNPMTQGSSGTVAGTGASGTASNGVTIQTINATGLTVVCAPVTAGTKRWDQITVSGTPTSAGPEVRFNLAAIAAGSLAAGDVIDGFCEFEIDAGQTGVNCTTLIMIDAGASGGSLTRSDLDRSQATDTYPTDAINGILRVPKFAIFSSNTVSPRFVVKLLQNVAASCVVRVRCIGARKVI